MESHYQPLLDPSTDTPPGKLRRSTLLKVLQLALVSAALLGCLLLLGLRSGVVPTAEGLSVRATGLAASRESEWCPPMQPGKRVSHPANLSGVVRPLITRAVVMGDTGVGKSTLVDLLAGGVYLANASATSTVSVTSGTTLYRFYWQGKPGAGVAEVADTPGFTDVCGRDVALADHIVAALRDMRDADTVFLLWNAESSRCTSANSGAFSAMRAYFKPEIWRKVVMVYTNWRWTLDLPWCPGGAGCIRNTSMLAGYHNLIMDCGYKRVQAMFGDQRCNTIGASARDCFPQSVDVPFVGYDLDVDSAIKYPIALDSSQYPGTPNNAQQLVRLRSFASSMAQSAAYDMTEMVNYWVACQQTGTGHNGQVLITDTSTDAEVCSAAQRLEQCFAGGPRPQMQSWAQWAGGRRHLQLRYAFCLKQDRSRDKVLTREHGFEQDIAEIVRVYADMQAYHDCRSATRPNVTAASVAPSAIKCYSAAGNAPAARERLLKAYQSRHDFKFHLAIAIDKDRALRSSGVDLLEVLGVRKVPCASCDASSCEIQTCESSAGTGEKWDGWDDDPELREAQCKSAVSCDSNSRRVGSKCHGYCASCAVQEGAAGTAGAVVGGILGGLAGPAGVAAGYAAGGAAAGTIAGVSAGAGICHR